MSSFYHTTPSVDWIDQQDRDDAARNAAEALDFADHQNAREEDDGRPNWTEAVSGLDTPGARAYIADRARTSSTATLALVLDEPGLSAFNRKALAEIYAAELARRRQEDDDTPPPAAPAMMAGFPLLPEWGSREHAEKTARAMSAQALMYFISNPEASLFEQALMEDVYSAELLRRLDILHPEQIAA